MNLWSIKTTLLSLSMCSLLAVIGVSEGIADETWVETVCPGDQQCWYVQGSCDKGFEIVGLDEECPVKEHCRLEQTSIPIPVIGGVFTGCRYTKIPCVTPGAFPNPAGLSCQEMEGCKVTHKTARFGPDLSYPSEWNTCTAAALLNEQKCPTGYSKKHSYAVSNGCCTVTTKCYDADASRSSAVSVEGVGSHADFEHK